jgi:N-6 DNA Methylase
MIDTLTGLIATFEHPDLDFSRDRADGDDILGDAYEFLMRHFATESGKSKGQFYIVDYMDLFKKVQGAINVYSSELDQSAGGVDPEVILQDRLTKGRKRLEEALEVIFLICEPVPPPRDDDASRRCVSSSRRRLDTKTDRVPLAPYRQELQSDVHIFGGKRMATFCDGVGAREFRDLAQTAWIQR